MARTTAASVESSLRSALASYKESASAIKKEHSTARDLIRDDPTTSDVGKRERREALDKQTRAKLAAVKADQDAYISTLRATVERDVRGNQPQDAASVGSRRDATARARAVTDMREAMDMLTDAIHNGDNVLALAIGSRAQTRMWGSVAEAYVSAYPDAANSETALAYVEGLSSDPALNVANSITYSMPD